MDYDKYISRDHQAGDSVRVHAGSLISLARVIRIEGEFIDVDIAIQGVSYRTMVYKALVHKCNPEDLI